MTKYLTGQPFSNAVSNGRMTDFQWDAANGNLVQCPVCGDYIKPEEVEICPMLKRVADESQ